MIVTINIDIIIIVVITLLPLSAGGVREACRSGSAGVTGGCGATSPSCRSSCGASAVGATSHSPLPPLCFWPFLSLGCGSGSFPLTTPSGKEACLSQGCLHTHWWGVVQDCPSTTPFGQNTCLRQLHLLECRSAVYLLSSELLLCMASTHHKLASPYGSPTLCGID